MLPFLKHKQVSALIISKRTPDDTAGKAEHAAGDEMHELEGICEDILRSITAKDAKALARSIKDAFEVADSYPHEEGEHTDEPKNEEEN